MQKTLSHDQQAVLKALHEREPLGGNGLHNATGKPLAGCHRTAASLVRRGLVIRYQVYGSTWYKLAR